jgi:hypothetical protein
MKPRLAIASIGPIHAKDLRFPKASPKPFDLELSVDIDHPITKALMEQLPKLNDLGVAKLREHLLTYNGRTNAMSSLQDVESWIAMVDEEIAHRAREQQGMLSTLLQIFVKHNSEGVK